MSGAVQITARGAKVVEKFVSPTGTRTIRGVATTPGVDLVGDEVVPTGAVYRLPLPLLWQHKHDQPIGWVTAAVVSAQGITVTCELATGIEAADKAWRHIESGLVAGLSIGFVAIKTEPTATGTRFLKWRWNELSVVTIAAQPDAFIAGTGKGHPGSVRLLPACRGAVELITTRDRT